MDFLSVISLVAGVVSLVLGVSALLQAKRYNDASAKLNVQTENTLSDMQKMLAFNMRAVCELQQRMPKRELPPNTVDLQKDSIKFHKLTTFNKEKSAEVMKLLGELSIKKKTLEDLQTFVLSDDTDYSTHFYASARTIDKIRLDVIVAELIKYGLIVDIYCYG